MAKKRSKTKGIDYHSVNFVVLKREVTTEPTPPAPREPGNPPSSKNKSAAAFKKANEAYLQREKEKDRVWNNKHDQYKSDKAAYDRFITAAQSVAKKVAEYTPAGAKAKASPTPSKKKR